MRTNPELTFEEHQSKIRLCKAQAIGGFATVGAGALLFTAEAMSDIHKTGFDMSATAETMTGLGIATGFVVGVAGMLRSIPHSVYAPEDCPPPYKERR